MKLTKLLKLTLLGAGAYYLYHNRQHIKQGWDSTKSEAADTKKTFQAAQQSFNQIKQDANTILQQQPLLSEIGKDLTYHFQSFNNETQARLAEIQSVLDKHQSTE